MTDFLLRGCCHDVHVPVSNQNLKSSVWIFQVEVSIIKWWKTNKQNSGRKRIFEVSHGNPWQCPFKQKVGQHGLLHHKLDPVYANSYQGLLLFKMVTPWTRLLKYSKNYRVFCHVTHYWYVTSILTDSHVFLFSQSGTSLCFKNNKDILSCVKLLQPCPEIFCGCHFEWGEGPRHGVAVYQRHSLSGTTTTSSS